MESTAFVTGDSLPAAGLNALRKDLIYTGADYVVATGTANAFVLTMDAQVNAYAAGMKLRFKANFSPTGACTVNVNGLGAKSIKFFNGRAVGQGHIVNNQIVECVYDGTDFLFLTYQTKDVICQSFMGTIGQYGIHGGFEAADGLRFFGNYQNGYFYEFLRDSLDGKWCFRQSSVVNVTYGCLAIIDAVEYLIGFNSDTPAGKYKWDLSTKVRTAMTFSGAPPSTLYNVMAYCAADGYVYMINNYNSATIRRYSVSGTVFTNVNSDLTLSQALGNPINMYIDGDVIVFLDRQNNYYYHLMSFNRLTGALITDQIVGYNTNDIAIFQNRDGSIGYAPNLTGGAFVGDKIYYLQLPV